MVQYQDCLNYAFIDIWGSSLDGLHATASPTATQQELEESITFGEKFCHKGGRWLQIRVCIPGRADGPSGFLDTGIAKGDSGSGLAMAG